MNPTVPLTCPTCRATPEFSASRIHCSACNKDFEIVDGIPVLRKNSETYYGEFPQSDMQTLLADARTDLEGTIRQYLRAQDAPPRLGEYILGRGRAGWQYLLPLNRQSTVLDLGCGWGTLAWSLAQLCGHVVACDSTLERMQLLNIRKELDKQDNLQLVCAGDTEFLPFPDNAFDGVVVNGVLEWVPGGLPGDPRAVQVAFLKEVRRVIKPDGCLFLGIENRYAWKTWAMNPDGHTGLRFVPWLPRPLATLYSKLKGKGDYRIYLYGPSQYRNLLAECGFDNTEFLVPSPGYHHPVQMIPFEDKPQLKRAFSRKEDTPFRQFRQSVKGTLSAHFPDAFGMIANDQKRPSFLKRLLRHLQDTLKLSADDLTYRMNGEMGIVTVITHGADPAIVKLPLHQRGLAELQRESSILKEVANPEHALNPTAARFARLTAADTFEEQNYFVYSVLPGVSGDHFQPNSPLFDRAIQSAAQFLGDLHQKTPSLDESLEQLVQPAQAAVLSLAATPQQRDLVNRLADRVRTTLAEDFAGAVWAHGDSKLANFMFEPDTAALSGVIDWGTGLLPELPGYDFSFLCVSSEAARTRTSLVSQLRQQLRNGAPSSLRPVIDAYTEQTGLNLSEERFKALIAYQWLKRLAPLADEFETMRFNHRYLDSMFEAVS